MISPARLSATALLGALFLLPIACGENQAGSPVMETGTQAPKQPTQAVKKSDDEWKKELTPEQYDVLRRSGTERASSKTYDEFKHQGSGRYYCAGCDALLFSSEHKFDARCGWPAFYDPANAKNVKAIEDYSLGMKRVEVRCAVCDGHLGHIFEGEGFDTPTDRRYCINGVALKFVPDPKEDSENKKVDSHTQEIPIPESKAPSPDEPDKPGNPEKSGSAKDNGPTDASTSQEEDH